MLQELADESDNQGLKMNKSKTMMMIEKTHPYLSTTFRSRPLKATSTWEINIAPKTKTKARRFKDKSHPDGQHSPSTATSSRVTLEHT